MALSRIRAAADTRLRRFYAWLGQVSRGPYALVTMLTISFAESSILPLAPDPLLVPMMLARPDRAWTLAGLCTAASVLGALVGYALGALLFDSIGQPILDFYGLSAAFNEYQARFAVWGFWIILAKGLTPIPFKLVTIASGVARFDLGLFLFACILTRSARFFLVAALLQRYGLAMRAMFDRCLGFVSLALLLLVLAAIGWLSWG